MKSSELRQLMELFERKRAINILLDLKFVGFIRVKNDRNVTRDFSLCLDEGEVYPVYKNVTKDEESMLVSRFTSTILPDDMVYIIPYFSTRCTTFKTEYTSIDQNSCGYTWMSNELYYKMKLSLEESLVLMGVSDEDEDEE